MKISRDYGFLDNLARSKGIKEWVFSDNSHSISSKQILQDKKNVFLKFGESAVFFMYVKDDVYEIDTYFKPKRPKYKTYTDIKKAFFYIKQNHQAKSIIARIPEHNVKAIRLALFMGFEKTNEWFWRNQNGKQRKVYFYRKVL